MSKAPERKVWEIQSHITDDIGNPLINIDAVKEKIKKSYSSSDGTRVRNYASVIHDKDFYTAEDVERNNTDISKGILRKPISAGQPKDTHIHIVLQMTEGVTAQWIKDRFGVTDTQIVYVKENRMDKNNPDKAETFNDKCAYLCHELQSDKALYQYSDIDCSFDYAEMMSRYVQAKRKRDSAKKNKKFVNLHVNLIAQGNETIRSFIDEYGFNTYADNKAKYDNAEAYYNKTFYQGPGIRLSILVVGDSTLGKTPLAKMLACSLYPEIENPKDVFHMASDAKVSLQSYNGQPVIIWDDWRAVSFLNAFGRETLFNSLFAVHPDSSDFNIKYGSTVLKNTVNIITCVDDYETFTKELAGEYTDSKGFFHKTEEKQIKQANKRIWGIFEMNEQDIIFKVNNLYLNHSINSYYLNQYSTIARIENKTNLLASKYRPELYRHLFKYQLPEFKERYDEAMESEKNKISDPSQIDWSDLGGRDLDDRSLKMYDDISTKYDELLNEMLLKKKEEFQSNFISERGLHNWNQFGIDAWRSEEASIRKELKAELNLQKQTECPFTPTCIYTNPN